MAESEENRTDDAGESHPHYPLSLGARYLGGGRASFLVWAPKAAELGLRLEADPERRVPMRPDDRGYFLVEVDDVRPGTRYRFEFDAGRRRPDPTSRFQPLGVHGPSEVVDSRFQWRDSGWFGIPLRDYVIYELHVGTFSSEGTFDAVIPHLDRLHDLGVTALEIMPVAQFPGDRNWGYDGVFPFAVQNSYGGPDGFKRLIDACHARGLAVVLDVVYNHLGPEGNYLDEFGHYFTDRYRTPWGRAVNFDDAHGDEVRRFFIENALHWIRDYHVDALRLDAIHAIFDFTSRPFLAELAESVRIEGERINRRVYTIAESGLNDPRTVLPWDRGGLGIDSQWCDDLHHAIHTLVTGERDGYYQDFRGAVDVATAYREGFVFGGRYSRYRKRRHGGSGRELPFESLVVCSQNHDQVGNRMRGERLGRLVSFEELKLAAGLVILSPYLPLLFMGEEYAEENPFQYFVSHGDAGLIEAVRKGRKEEFSRFHWRDEPPDPQAETTFTRSRLNHHLREEGRHAVLFRFYQALIRLRRSRGAWRFGTRADLEIRSHGEDQVLFMSRRTRSEHTLVCFNLGERSASFEGPLPDGLWERLLDSADTAWEGPGSSTPERLESTGAVSLTLEARSLVAFERNPK
jgi:maltooligosyltrehalose trehalohydrolase